LRFLQLCAELDSIVTHRLRRLENLGFLHRIPFALALIGVLDQLYAEDAVLQRGEVEEDLIAEALAFDFRVPGGGCFVVVRDGVGEGLLGEGAEEGSLAQEVFCDA